MKLVFCPECEDVKKLEIDTPTFCHCGRSWGRYLTDGLHAEYGGDAILLALGNTSLIKAVAKELAGQRRIDGLGFKIEAWVIPTTSDRITKTMPIPKESG